MSRVKAFVLGTDFDESAREALLSFAVADLRRMAGYIPPALSDDTPPPKLAIGIFAPLTHKNFNLWVEEFKEKYAGDEISTVDMRALWRYFQWSKTLDKWKPKIMRSHPDWIQWYELHCRMIQLAWSPTAYNWSDRKYQLQRFIRTEVRPTLELGLPHLGMNYRSLTSGRLVYERDYIERVSKLFHDCYYAFTGNVWKEPVNNALLYNIQV